MKRVLVVLLLACAAAVSQAADWNSDPEALVRSFDKENAKFNIMAYALTDSPEDQSKITEAWNKIREKYFIPNYKGAPGAYISDTVIRRLEEKFEVKSVSETKAVVLLTVKERNSVLNTVATGTIEYHLIRDAGRWYIENVYVYHKGKQYKLYDVTSLRPGMIVCHFRSHEAVLAPPALRETMITSRKDNVQGSLL
jgi:hypothetical protein